jgi:hypothetical protein
VSGETLDYKKHLSFQIGHYCQVHKEYDHRNSQLARTKGAISLGPCGNLQGDFKFMALNTRKNIVLRSWDVIPIPDLVISRVNSVGSDQPHQMTFTDRHGRLIGDIEIPGVDSDEDDDENFPEVAPVIEDYMEIPGVDVEGPDIPTPQIVDIDDLYTPPKMTQLQLRWHPPKQCKRQKRQHRSHNQHQHQGTVDPRESGMSMTGSKYSYAVTQMESQ